MTRSKSLFVCQECGASQSKWVGRCDGCSAWNSFIEEPVNQTISESLNVGNGNKIELLTLKGTGERVLRTPTGINEFDRVCGGGLVSGSAVLLGGDPGIGKSTLLLQVVSAIANSSDDGHCIYFSGEEAVDQVRLRGDRLGLSNSPVELATSTSVRDISSTLSTTKKVRVVIIDSIQTLFVDNLNSAPGTISQVRTSAQELIRLAKSKGFTLFLVGHVTKDGMLAGPKVLEHMVDTVLYFEGERNHTFRILRVVKNRFGAIDEIGVFEMMNNGLNPISNPSALFLSNHNAEISGASVFAGNEGKRPILVEVQALTASTPFGTPRRTVVGWDIGRLNMVLAVLEARCGLSFGSHDVYLNIAGGLRITEPAADLAVAAALVSSLTNVPVPAKSIIFGEIGLSGEIRAVSQSKVRLKEAAKMGFSQAITPSSDYNKNNSLRAPNSSEQIDITEIRVLNDLLGLFQNESNTENSPIINIKK